MEEQLLEIESLIERIRASQSALVRYMVADELTLKVLRLEMSLKEEAKKVTLS